MFTGICSLNEDVWIVSNNHLNCKEEMLMKTLKVKVENMQSNNGNDIPNQFRIFTDDGCYFQSYSSVIAYKPFSGKVVLDVNKWDYSITTGKYRNLFLRETKKETERKIKEGIYQLSDLNV
jgi:hypothetical protein